MASKHFNILSTGLLSDKSISKAAESGIHIDIVPFYTITRFSDKETAALIHDLSAKNRSVIFTSKHAVHAVIACLDTIPNWQIYCLNGATKKAVTSFWKNHHIIGEANNGKELALNIIAQQKQDMHDELVFFCGEKRLDTIPQLLATHHIPLKEIVVYTTTPTPHLIKDKYDGILFFNPIGVHSFFSCNQVNNEILFAIGETTSDAIATNVNNTQQVMVANQACKEFMVEEVINTFKNK